MVLILVSSFHISLLTKHVFIWSNIHVSCLNGIREIYEITHTQQMSSKKPKIKFIYFTSYGWNFSTIVIDAIQSNL